MANITLPKPFSDPGDQTLATTASLLGLQTKEAVVFLEYALKLAILFDKKHQDYGPRNISEFGLFGVVVKMNDKMCRLKELVGKKRRKPRNESIRDTLQDQSCYGIIGQMLEDGIWPTT
jgi:hypothetical protein